MTYETPSSEIVTLALALKAASFRDNGSFVFVAFWIWRKAGWDSVSELGLGFLEYLDFLPGMEGLEGEEGVPMDLKVSFVVVVVTMAVS